jgi:hypothetical protein
VLRDSGQAEEAEAEFRRVLAIQQKLAASQPLPDLQNDVAGTLGNIALL